MHLIAMDGRNFPALRSIPEAPICGPQGQVPVAPANRAEFLIKAVATPGTYRIMQVAQDQQFLASAQKAIAESVVAGPPKDMALPAALPLNTRD